MARRWGISIKASRADEFHSNEKFCSVLKDLYDKYRSIVSLGPHLGCATVWSQRGRKERGLLAMSNQLRRPTGPKPFNFSSCPSYTQKLVISVGEKTMEIKPGLREELLLRTKEVLLGGYIIGIEWIDEDVIREQ